MHDGGFPQFVSRAHRVFLCRVIAIAGASALLLVTITLIFLAPVPNALPPRTHTKIAPIFLDRQGSPLNVTFKNQLNWSTPAELTQIPPLLVAGFITSEDKRFFSHQGVDWRARAQAVIEFFKFKRIVRGGSSITEQVVRIITPRPRTVWSRWLEGWEAVRLEDSFNKQEILRFYINQVPYGAQRRGVVQAANYYFGRDPSTLNIREQLALVVLVRAPERLSPQRNAIGLNRRIEQLAARLHQDGALTDEQLANLRESSFSAHIQKRPVEAGHFVQYLKEQRSAFESHTIQSTLDGELQSQIQQALRISLRRFKENQIAHGAVLVTDHDSGEVLAWVNDRTFGSNEKESQIDAVLVPRQPGSTLKPFVYAAALERGWTAATVIDDSPLFRQVGSGLHRYRNYSRIFHGPVRLRVALGSSLNIPAILGAEFVGRSALLRQLQAFGLESLHESADFYGEGLALGNGEIPLRELVTAYATLARGGRTVELSGFADRSHKHAIEKKVISSESASIISDILADSQARILEFGRGGVLQFPTETAIKTGTSTGYRDLWAIGYSARFTAGVWMGNLDRTPTHGVTSTQGPAVLLRSVFSLLEKRWDGAPLPKRGELEYRELCLNKRDLPTSHDTVDCRKISELFSKKKIEEAVNSEGVVSVPSILIPSPGLVVARDPRIPNNLERLAFKLSSSENIQSVRWFVDGQLVATEEAEPFSYAWPLLVGSHGVVAEVVMKEGGRTRSIRLGEHRFFVQ